MKKMNFSPQATGHFVKSEKHLDVGFDDSSGGGHAPLQAFGDDSGHDGH